MDADTAKHLKFKQQGSDHSSNFNDAFKDTTNNIPPKHFRLMSSNSNRSDSKYSSHQLKIKKFKSSVVNQNENQFQPSLKRYKTHKPKNQSTSQCPSKEKQFKGKCGSSISSDSKNSRGSSFSQSYQSKIKSTNWRKYLTKNSESSQNNKRYKPKIKPYQTENKGEGEKMKTVPQMKWQRKQNPVQMYGDDRRNEQMDYLPERHDMKYIERKNLETDASLKIANQKSSKPGSVTSFYMQSQEKTHAQLDIHDPILEEEDELLCLENADDLKIDETYKSPDIKGKGLEKHHNLDIKLNYNGRLDSANLCTQAGAENVEPKTVSEVSKFESDRLAEAKTVVGQKQVELKPQQVLKHASQFELSDLDQELEIVKSKDQFRSNNISGESQNRLSFTANMPYDSLNMNSMRRSNQTLPTLCNQYTQLTLADQKLNTQHEGQFQQTSLNHPDIEERDSPNHHQLQLSSKQKSTTWRNEQNLKVETKQEQSIESKFQNLNLDNKVATLKSPKAEKNFNWMDLVQDAVCLNDDDEEPFQPVAYQSNTEHKENMIYVNVVDAKKEENKQHLSCSEGLTDGGESPNKEKGADYLQVEKKHYYDPHEPHSAQTRPFESLKFKDESLSPDSIPSNVVGQQKQFKNIHIECEAIDEESQNHRPSYPDQELALLACEDEEELFIIQDVSDNNRSQEGMSPDNEINMNNQNTDRQEILIQRNNEEADLVEDGFFDNLMKNQTVRNLEESNEPYKNYGSLENTAQSIPGQPTAPEFSQFLHEKQDETWSPIGQLPPQPEDKITKNINNQIYEKVKQTYFPQMTQKFEIFQGMLKKEQIILQKMKQQRQQHQSLFERQTELTPDMRLTLLDWLCQVSTDYCLKRQTYHLALSYTDHYLQNCQQHIHTSDFQLIGVTCLHMAAKFEEIYPPHINQFAESTNDSVTAEQIIQTEYKICNVLDWNFDQFQTTNIWASWFMKRWDEYVDESLSYLKQQFQLKFLEGTSESHYKFITFMQFVDILSISYNSKQYSPREMVACIMYLLIGGKDIMCAFQIDYREMFSAFQEQFPIIHPDDINNSQGQRLPEGILFYNQIIQPFFNNEFGYYLHDLIEPMKYVLRYFTLDVSGENSKASNGLIQQCKFIMHQQSEMAIERMVQAQDQGFLPNITILPNSYATYQDYTDQEVFDNVAEFFSFQTYNQSNLDTLKFLQNIPESKPNCNLLSPTNEVSQPAMSLDSSQQLQQADMYDLSQPRVISVNSGTSFEQ